MTMKPWRLILFELGSVPHGSPGTKAGCPGSLLHDQVGSAWQLWKKKTWLKSLSKINGNSTCETNTMLCQLSLNKKNFFSISKGKDCPQTLWKRPRIYREVSSRRLIWDPPATLTGYWLQGGGWEWGVRSGRFWWFCFRDPSVPQEMGL